MERRALIAVFRVAFAVLAVVAIITQISAMPPGVFNPANFFSYFTIQSNVIGIAVFLIGAARYRSIPSASWDLVRGGAAIYLTVTFVVFWLLLSGTDVDTTVPWVNIVLHGVFPVAVVVDWLIDPPARSIPFRRALWWLAYPIAWIAYTLVRGPIAQWYPYPFLNPANGGYATVAVYIVGIFIFGVVLVAIFSGVGNRLGRVAER